MKVPQTARSFNNPYMDTQHNRMYSKWKRHPQTGRSFNSPYMETHKIDYNNKIILTTQFL